MMPFACLMLAMAAGIDDPPNSAGSPFGADAIVKFKANDRERPQGGPPVHLLIRALDGDGKLSERELRPLGAPPRP